MAIKTKKLALLAGAALLGASSLTLAADLVGGASARMLAETCAGCHGTDGASVGPASPSIAGMNAEYFTEIMKGFKSGEIYSTIMGRIAKGYTDEELAQMAGFFAKQKFVPAKQQFAKADVRTGGKLHEKYCEKCHAEGGKVVEGEEYYILAGQWSPYLANALSDFQENRRPMPKKMAAQVKKLMEKEGEKGVAALWAFYASQQ